jgi:hypothetical protein
MQDSSTLDQTGGR